MESLMSALFEMFAILVLVSFSMGALLAVVAIGYVIVVLSVGGYRMARDKRKSKDEG